MDFFDWYFYSVQTNFTPGFNLLLEMIQVFGKRKKNDKRVNEWFKPRYHARVSRFPDTYPWQEVSWIVPYNCPCIPSPVKSGRDNKHTNNPSLLIINTMVNTIG